MKDKMNFELTDDQRELLAPLMTRIMTEYDSQETFIFCCPTDDLETMRCKIIDPRMARVCKVLFESIPE